MIAGFGLNKKLEILLQTEAAECGIACLAMIANYHGHHTDLRNLRQRFSTSLRGINLHNLMQHAESMGFITRPIRAEPEELNQLQLPCILHFDMNHFVVLEGCTKRHFKVFDPAFGEILLSQKEFSNRFTGVILEITPEARFVTRKKNKSLTAVDIFGRVNGFSGAVTKIIALSFAIEFCAITSPFISQWAIDEAVVSGDRSLLTTLLVAYLFVYIFQTFVECIREFAVLHMNASVGIQWFSKVCDRLIRLPLDYFEKRQVGDVIARMSAVGTVQQTLGNGMIGGVVDGVMCVVTFTVMVVYSPTLSLLSACILLLYLTLRMAIYKAIKSTNSSQFIFGAQLQTYLIESIRGIQTIKLFGKEADRIAAISTKAVRQANAAMRVAQYSLIFRISNSFLFRIETVVVLGMAGLAVIDKTFTIGMFFAFSSFREQFARRVSSLIDKIFDYRMLGIQMDRLGDIMLEKPEKYRYDYFSSSQEEEIFDLHLSSVCFKYAEDLPEIIRDFNLVIRAGEHVAIVGESGCGKTTLLKILTGLLEPTKGDVFYSGIRISNIKDSYRAICATVTQDDVLFAGSIAENISFFDQNPDHFFIRHCAQIAAISEEIKLMPMQYDTLVGDMGSALSGGQKQRILLARALYKKPKILFLDEATSHLDASNERNITRAISDLCITRVVIAHRKETIDAAERIIRIAPNIQLK